jgi:hypothetical protein
VNIRTHNKDQLKNLVPPLMAVPSITSDIPRESADPLKYWTKHDTKKMLVDLRVFRDGQAKNRQNRIGNWRGPFTGRPVLIAQIAPVMRDLSEFMSSGTNTQYLCTLRSWWRLLDSVETAARTANLPITPVVTVGDITEIHRQWAFDHAMNRNEFSTFVRLINVARSAIGFKQLYWNGPEQEAPIRHLPPKWQTDKIRFALKRGWFGVLDHWSLAEQLLADPIIEEEKQLIEVASQLAKVNAQQLIKIQGRQDELKCLRENYKNFKAVVQFIQNPTPTVNEIQSFLLLSRSEMYRRGFSLSTMQFGFYPNGVSIRIAFHLCLAYCGWNPSVLLALNVNDKFIEAHPKDAKRYIMRGFKARGGFEQLTDGLFKSQGSPGSILLTLIKRTEPLRRQLDKELKIHQSELATLTARGAKQAEIDAKIKGIHYLQNGLRSPWLYTEKSTGRSESTIQWLHDKNYSKIGAYVNFLKKLIGDINQKQPADKQVEHLVAGDFRDAFAAFSYLSSGGSVLAVMRALGHRQLGSTQRYLDNTLINERSESVFRSFSQSLWHEIKVYGRVDPTILAKWSRDGDVTEEQRHRHAEYRDLRRSRVGVGCKDPTHPPKTIDPSFIVEGTTMCRVQRCMLCIEHAVIFPDSLAGIAKRLAELMHIKTCVPLQTFNESSFDTELENTELALKGFDRAEVDKHVIHWEQQIKSGKHRVIDLEGAYK